LLVPTSVLSAAAPPLGFPFLCADSFPLLWFHPSALVPSLCACSFLPLFPHRQVTLLCRCLFHPLCLFHHLIVPSFACSIPCLFHPLLVLSLCACSIPLSVPCRLTCSIPCDSSVSLRFFHLWCLPIPCPFMHVPKPKISSYIIQIHERNFINRCHTDTVLCKSCKGLLLTKRWFVAVPCTHGLPQLSITSYYYY
jgi:hypothetical protein